MKGEANGATNMQSGMHAEIQENVLACNNIYCTTKIGRI